MKKRGRLFSAWDVEYNGLSKTFSLKLVCDDEVLSVVEAIAGREERQMTEQELADQLVELLERSIHANLPRSHRFWKKKP